MKKTLSALLVCFCILGIGICELFAGTVIKLQCAYPENANVGKSTQFFADEVKKLTNGEVEIRIFWPGQLVKTEEAFNAIRMGMIDAYSGSLLYFVGMVPEVNVQWLPFNWIDAKEAQEVFEKTEYLKIMNEALKKHGLLYLAPLSVGSMGLMTKFPVNTIEDLKGKKIRAVGMEAEIVKALGASAVNIAGAEQYMALQRGVADGTDYPWYTMEQYKFYEVLKYIIKPAFHTPGIVEIIISEKTFEGLSESQKKAIKEAATAAMKRSIELTDQWDRDALINAEKHGVKVIELSEKEVRRLRELTAPLWDAEAKRSKYSEELVKILKEYNKMKGREF
ncbi:MAG: TRAP transporter substrate-binding protein [Thermodesulforhabdaceae bacterium]